MSAARPSVLALGTISLDTIESGGEVARDVLGGSAPYFASAARLWTDVSMVGLVGEDFPPPELARLDRAGIDTSLVERAPGETFRWHARYRSDGSRETLATNRAAALDGTPALPADAPQREVLFLGSTDPAAQASVLSQAGVPRLVVLDTMSHWIRDRRAELEILTRSADVLLLTEEEASLLGDGDHEKGIRPVLEAGCSWVVVKRGAEGAIAFGHDRAVAASVSRPAVVRDPTGAGDAFAGGLVAALAGSWPDRLGMEEAIARGSALGSLAVESFSVDRLLGATPEGVESRAREVRVRVRHHRRGT